MRFPAVCLVVLLLAAGPALAAGAHFRFDRSAGELAHATLPGPVKFPPGYEEFQVYDDGMPLLALNILWSNGTDPQKAPEAGIHVLAVRVAAPSPSGASTYFVLRAVQNEEGPPAPWRDWGMVLQKGIAGSGYGVGSGILTSYPAFVIGSDREPAWLFMMNINSLALPVAQQPAPVQLLWPTVDRGLAHVMISPDERNAMASQAGLATADGDPGFAYGLKFPGSILQVKGPWTVRVQGIADQSERPVPTRSGEPEAVPMADSLGSDPGLGRSTGALLAWEAAVAVGIGVAGMVSAPSIRWRVLASLAGLALFSRVAGPRLLAHWRRRRIHEIVAADPGIRFTRARELSGMARGTFLHHTAMLEKGGHLQVVRDGGFTCLYVRPVSVQPAQPLGPRGALLRLVQEEPGMDQAALARRLGIPAPTAAYHLRRLVSSGILRTHAEGRRTRYFPGRPLPEVVAAQLRGAGPDST